MANWIVEHGKHGQSMCAACDCLGHKLGDVSFLKRKRILLGFSKIIIYTENQNAANDCKN